VAQFLFVIPPFVGHVMPAAGVAAELGRRGHDVAWVAHAGAVGHLLGEGAVVHDVGDGHLAELAGLLPEHDRLRGPASLQFLWERVLVPLALAMLDPVRAAVDDHRPDVVVTDQQAFAGALVAHEDGRPWAVSASSTAELVEPLAAVPRIAAWVEAQVDRLWTEAGIPGSWAAPAGAGAGDVDPRFSPYLTLQYSTEDFVGPLDRTGRTRRSVAFVGPVIRRPDEVLDDGWHDWLDRHERNVLVSLGTVTQGKGVRFLQATVDAVAGAPYGVAVVAPDGLGGSDGRGGRAGAGELPANVRLAAHVPQLALLAHLDAVVCHAGYNTVAEALWHGVPLVCAPIREDQPHNAGNVVRSGAGRRLSFGRATAPDIRAALDAVLTDPQHRTAAARVARSFRDAGGAARAADLVEALTDPTDPADPARSGTWMSRPDATSRYQNGGGEGRRAGGDGGGDGRGTRG
jgi:MGT family glycosyltransferase